MLFPAQSSSLDHAQQQSSRTSLEFLAVCDDRSVFTAVAAAVRQVNGRLHCAASVGAANDCLIRSKMDGIVIDMNLPGALDLITRVRGANLNRFSVIFACMGSSPDTQLAIRAGANFVLQKPLLADKVAHVFAAASDMMVAEKRRFLRFPLMVSVSLAMKEREVESTMSNLSEGGMAIWSLYYYAPGSTLQFAFDIPFGGPIQGDGVVAWTGADGLVGIKFHMLSQQASRHLTGWIARREANHSI